MKAIENVDLTPGDFEAREQKTVIHFEEGLTGFSDVKDFNLLENDYLAPFRLLRAVDDPDVGFLVLDATARVDDYCHLIPLREWKSLGVTNPEDYLAFITVVLGATAEESTGNLQAPLLVNHQKMTGKQIILTDSGFSVREPLL